MGLLGAYLWWLLGPGSDRPCVLGYVFFGSHPGGLCLCDRSAGVRCCVAGGVVSWPLAVVVGWILLVRAMRLCDFWCEGDRRPGRVLGGRDPVRFLAVLVPARVAVVRVAALLFVLPCFRGSGGFF